MPRNAAIDDLFGDVPQRAAPVVPAASSGRGEITDEYIIHPNGDRLLYPAIPPGGHTAETIRPVLLAILAETRALAVLDWGPRKLRSYTANVPYMAEWLKGGEGDRLLGEFKREIDRLQAPVDQLAPNWRRIWKLDL